MLTIFLFPTAAVIIFGLVYLGSTSALNAILSSSVVMLQWSYCVPVTLLLIRGRGLLDVIAREEEERLGGGDSLQNGGISPLKVTRRYNLGKFGYIINIWGVLFAIFTSIL